MTTAAELATLLTEKNQAAFRKIAEQSLGLSKLADLQFARVLEPLRRFGEMNDGHLARIHESLRRVADVDSAQITELRRHMAMTVQMQEALASSSLVRLDAQVTEMMRRAMEGNSVIAWQRQLALDMTQGQLAQATASIAASLKYTDDIPRRLGLDILASLNAFNQGQWEILRAAVLPRMDDIFAAAVAAGSPDHLVLDDFVGAEVEPVDFEDDREAAPLVLTRFQLIVIAYIMTMAIWFFSLGAEGLTREKLQEDIHVFAVGVLGALTILLLKPPNEN